MPLGVLRPSFRTLLCGLSACLAMFVLLGASGAAPAKAAPTPMSAVLLTSSVTNDPTTVTQSYEYQEAEADGYTVTPVDDATWSSWTTAQFAAYQLIIIGDQAADCSYREQIGTEAESTASAWEPAVMDSGGNKVLIGTDPSHHLNLGDTSSAQLEQNGLSYAGAVSGATGLYLDLGCSFEEDAAGTDEPILDGLTNGTGTFTVEGYNDPSLPGGQACATNVNIVASTGPTSGLTDGDLSDPTEKYGCAVHEAFTSFPSDYTPLVLASTSSGFPSVYCANDVQSSTQACGAPYILVSGGGVSVSSDISLSPASQDQTTAPGSPGSATVTATVTSGGSPDSGESVTFRINSGPDTGKSSTVTTDSSGQASFTINNTGASGTDSVSASFTNTSGNVEKALATVDFQGPGQPNAAASDLTGTEQTALGDPTVATFTDPSGQVSNWNTQINWGDGTATDTSGTVTPTGTANQYDLNADHTYASPGIYTVTITVTDATNSAYTTTVTSTATITKGQLSASAQSFSPTEGTSSSGTVATFTNTDTGPGASSYSATIDWGDGSSTSNGTITAVSGNPGNFTVSGSHTYAEAGTYTVKVTVTGGDDSTTTASDQVTITVGEAPITVSAGTINSTASQGFSGQVATFTDGDTLTPLSDYTATIDWGDGTSTSTSTGTISGSGGSYTVTGNHTYATPGSYPLKVTVSENDSGPSATDASTGSATVGDGQLSVSAQSFSPTEGTSSSGTVATFTDTDTGPAASSYSATIDWGDGSSTSDGTIGAVSGTPGSFTVTGEHTYAEAGTYTVKVTVTAADDSSLSKSDSVSITVGEAPITVSAGTINPTAGQGFSGQVATFTDGDTLTPLNDYTATIDWGDGTTPTTGTITGSGGSFTVTGNHTYATPGTYPLKVTVAENDSGPSASGTDTGTATAADSTLTVTGRGTLQLPSETLSGTLATVHYGISSAKASDFRANIKWGDGATGTGTVSGSGGNYTVAGAHTFSGSGPYPVTVTVTDPAGTTASATTTIMVPTTVASLSLPATISAKKLLCGVKHGGKCTGVTILGTFRGSGSAAWHVFLSKSGKRSVSLGTITRTVSPGATKLVFKVTKRKQAKRLYKLVKKHRLNLLTVQQAFTNVAGGTSQTSLFTRVTR